MSPIVLVILAGLALLAVLITIAIYQRGQQAEVAASEPPPSRPTAPEPARTQAAPHPPLHPAQFTPVAPRPLTLSSIAVGVFLGLWMFALSIGLPILFYIYEFSKHRHL